MTGGELGPPTRCAHSGTILRCSPPTLAAGEEDDERTRSDLVSSQKMAEARTLGGQIKAVGLPSPRPWLNDPGKATIGHETHNASRNRSESVLMPTVCHGLPP